MGVTLGISKGQGVGTGLGSSAASASAAAVAVNTLLGNPLSPLDVVRAVVDAETHVSGAHADNAAAAVLGGLVMVQSMHPLSIHSLPIPSDSWLALLTPDVIVNTKSARSVLPEHVTRDTAVGQVARFGAMVHACYADDLELFGRSAIDAIAHEARIQLIPCGPSALCAAEGAGAFGVFISGSGPTLAAVTRGEDLAQKVVEAMGQEMDRGGVSWQRHISPVSSKGARPV